MRALAILHVCTDGLVEPRGQMLDQETPWMRDLFFGGSELTLGDLISRLAEETDATDVETTNADTRRIFGLAN